MTGTPEIERRHKAAVWAEALGKANAGTEGAVLVKGGKRHDKD